MKLLLDPLHICSFRSPMCAGSIILVEADKLLASKGGQTDGHVRMDRLPLYSTELPPPSESGALLNMISAIKQRIWKGRGTDDHLLHFDDWFVN